ncbi:hypothetical protein EJ05DRAFT_475083 [Pseudovirgaria hyperparasitica]|uniref:Uncharacterized protein n=1 Tax=Pseudovirgaria hyperparasitica TaxID=470096 RepID=A0A6A6WDY7_9PEZI|nr:uncharacterized protein EJ05DRAFT_475083 [Pseudovirgaria hyperparasitica]KAF2760066.1 hypothetical protein EJ05DRAFT_475083 [Pseudovirgaria hyperparasitica]
MYATPFSEWKNNPSPHRLSAYRFLSPPATDVSQPHHQDSFPIDHKKLNFTTKPNMPLPLDDPDWEQYSIKPGVPFTIAKSTDTIHPTVLDNHTDIITNAPPSTVIKYILDWLCHFKHMNHLSKPEDFFKAFDKPVRCAHKWEDDPDRRCPSFWGKGLSIGRERVFTAILSRYGAGLSKTLVERKVTWNGGAESVVTMYRDHRPAEITIRRLSLGRHGDWIWN